MTLPTDQPIRDLTPREMQNIEGVTRPQARYHRPAQIVTLLRSSDDPAQAATIFKKLSPLDTLLPAVFELLGTIPSPVIDTILDSGRKEELAQVASVLAQLSAAQRKRLLRKHPLATMSAIAASVDVTALTDTETKLFTYSRADKVRLAFAARDDVPVDDRITALVGRLPADATMRFADDLPPYHRAAGLPIAPSSIAIPHRLTKMLPSLSVEQMNRLSTTSFPSVMVAVAYAATTTRQLGNLAAGFYEYARHVELAGRASTEDKRLASLRATARALRAVSSRFRTAERPEVDDAIAAIRDALVYFVNTPAGYADITHILSPSFEESFFAAVDVLTSSESLADAVLPDFKKMTIQGIAVWVEQNGSQAPLPDVAVDPLLDCAIRRLPAITIRNIVRYLPQDRIIDALERLAPLNLRPWRDDLPALFTLTEVAHVISVPQMFLFPVGQVREYLDDAGVKPADAVGADLIVTGLTPAAVTAIGF